MQPHNIHLKKTLKIKKRIITFKNYNNENSNHATYFNYAIQYGQRS